MSRRPHRLSGLQRQVLSLYRSALRVSHAKEEAGGDSIASFARQELERFRGVPTKDIQRIEHLIRRGKRQLELFQASDTSGVHLHVDSGGGKTGSSTDSSSTTGSSQAAAQAAAAAAAAAVGEQGSSRGRGEPWDARGSGGS